MNTKTRRQEHEITIRNTDTMAWKEVYLANDVTLDELEEALITDGFIKYTVEFINKRTSEILKKNVSIEKLDLIKGDEIELYVGTPYIG